MHNQNLFKGLIVGMICLGMTITANAQDQKTRFVLKLDDDLVSSFKSYGSLRSAVPDEYKKKISFVELQFADTSTLPPVEMNLDFQTNGDNANIVLDDAAIAAVKQNPVRVPVSDNAGTFSQIVLMYDAPVAGNANAEMTTPTPPALNSGGAPVDQYYVQLSNKSKMSGSIDGFDQFEIETRFGKVSMPMDQVAGIKFHTDSRDSCVVVLNNGDVVTGVPTIPAIELKTDWGQADIEPKFMDALLTSSAAKFSQENSDFGLRWNLKTGNTVAPSAPDFGGN